MRGSQLLRAQALPCSSTPLCARKPSHERPRCHSHRHLSQQIFSPSTTTRTPPCSDSEPSSASSGFSPTGTPGWHSARAGLRDSCPDASLPCPIRREASRRRFACLLAKLPSSAHHGSSSPRLVRDATSSAQSIGGAAPMELRATAAIQYSRRLAWCKRRSAVGRETKTRFFTFKHAHAKRTTER